MEFSQDFFVFIVLFAFLFVCSVVNALLWVVVVIFMVKQLIISTIFHQKLIMVIIIIIWIALIEVMGMEDFNYAQIFILKLFE